jgi:(p)ppGpp synthase/HD superfamily hydrolase
MNVIQKNHLLRISNPLKFDKVVLKTMHSLFPKSKLRQKKFINSLKILSSLDKKHSGFNMMHPLRVTFYSTVFFKKDINLLLLSMFHNLFEIKKIKRKKYETILGRKITSQISKLTMIKKKKFDDIYINNFYKKIYSSNKDTQIVKCLDKFDNLYNLYKNPDKDIKIKYLKEIEKFVLPLIKNNRNFKNYYLKLIKRNYNLIKKG